LIAPEAVHAPEWNERILPVDLSQDQVRESPDVETEHPVSRQYETSLREHYSWPLYWAGSMYPATPFALPLLQSTTVQTTLKAPEGSAPSRTSSDPHLRSTNEVGRYRIRASDGEIGHAVDFLIDDRSWNIRYLVVDTRNWLPGRKVVVSPWWITEVKWLESEIVTDLSKETVKNSPEYDSDHPMTVDYSGKLHDYYGRPRQSGWRQRLVAMSIESPVFENMGTIPKRYTRFGENHQPPLLFSGIPPETATLALLMDDPDAPKGVFTHWIVFNLNPQLSGLVEDSNLDGADEGLNDSGKTGYTGPYPPSGEHRYFFRLYALDRVLDLPDEADRESFLEAIEGHVLSDAVWVGRVAAQTPAERRK
jgi:Raf kinase inhibitor-like YbhB/YbcL family protein